MDREEVWVGVGWTRGYRRIEEISQGDLEGIRQPYSRRKGEKRTQGDRIFDLGQLLIPRPAPASSPLLLLVLTLPLSLVSHASALDRDIC